MTLGGNTTGGYIVQANSAGKEAATLSIRWSSSAAWHSDKVAPLADPARRPSGTVVFRGTTAR